MFTGLFIRYATTSNAIASRVVPRGPLNPMPTIGCCPFMTKRRIPVCSGSSINPSTFTPDGMSPK